jgi:hypothetical protein
LPDLREWRLAMLMSRSSSRSVSLTFTRAS